MTKVQLRFELLRPLDESLLEQIARVHSVYGIVRVQIPPAMDQLLVEYDASRLNPHEVENVLQKAGIPVALRA